MKKEIYLTHRNLADMHGDGVYFNKNLLKRAREHQQSRTVRDQKEDGPRA